MLSKTQLCTCKLSANYTTHLVSLQIKTPNLVPGRQTNGQLCRTNEELLVTIGFLETTGPFIEIAEHIIYNWMRNNNKKKKRRGNLIVGLLIMNFYLFSSPVLQFHFGHSNWAKNGGTEPTGANDGKYDVIGWQRERSDRTTISNFYVGWTSCRQSCEIQYLSLNVSRKLVITNPEGWWAKYEWPMWQRVEIKTATHGRIEKNIGCIIHILDLSDFWRVARLFALWGLAELGEPEKIEGASESVFIWMCVRYWREINGINIELRGPILYQCDMCLPILRTSLHSKIRSTACYKPVF